MLSRQARTIASRAAPKVLPLANAFAPSISTTARIPAVSSAPAVSVGVPSRAVASASTSSSASLATSVALPPLFSAFPARTFASTGTMQVPWPTYEAEGEYPFRRPSGIVADRAALTAHIAGVFAADYFANLAVDADGRVTSLSSAAEGSRAPHFSPLVTYLSPAPDNGEAEANRLYRRAVIDATAAQDKSAFYRGALIALARALVKDSPQASKCPDCQVFLLTALDSLEGFHMNSVDETEAARSHLNALFTIVKKTDEGVVAEVARRLLGEGTAADAANTAAAGTGGFLSTLFGGSTAGGFMAASAAALPSSLTVGPGPVAGPAFTPPMTTMAVGPYGAQPPAPLPPNVDPAAQPQQPGLGSMLVSGLLFGTVFAIAGRLFM